MTTPHFPKNKITSGFWRARLDMNAATAIFFQWEQLEKSGCIDNFRIAAGWKEGWREGYFFADSDAYKWLDAASRILGENPTPRLQTLVDDFITLLEAAQMPDGYLYTYNQIHFPGERWVNLQIEHELYCLGHLIEAGIAHHTATGQTRLLELARRVADLLVRDFMEAGPAQTDGHEEIEQALIHFYRHTAEHSYFELARRLLERRGTIPSYASHLINENNSHEARKKIVRERRVAYVASHPEHANFQLPPENEARKMTLGPIRQRVDRLNGKYFQQNAPIRQQTVPVGHSVRFTYLETACAMLVQQTGDLALRAALETAWNHMVMRRMYVTGGLGSLPFTEGFGNDYELDPEFAYAETCAALGSMFWSREMARLTHDPRYPELYEWQLYNAASVGVSADGQRYLYNNPLACRNGLTRLPWYAVPCCPSNLSRTYAWLADDICIHGRKSLWLQQYVGAEIGLEHGKLVVASGLPWQGDISIRFELTQPEQTTLYLRIPTWASTFTLLVNDQPCVVNLSERPTLAQTACGYDPRMSRYATLEREWQPGDVLHLKFSMFTRIYRQDRRIPNCGGKVALARGPLVYCLESVDNPQVDLFNVHLFSNEPVEAVFDENLLGGIFKLMGKTSTGQALTFIPYFLWANRGASQMNMFVKV